MLHQFFILLSMAHAMERIKAKDERRCSVVHNKSDTNCTIKYYNKDAWRIDFRQLPDFTTLAPDAQATLCFKKANFAPQETMIIEITPETHAPPKTLEIPTMSRKSIIINQGTVDLIEQDFKAFTANDKTLIQSQKEALREKIQQLEIQEQLFDQINDGRLDVAVRVEYSFGDNTRIGDLVFVEDDAYLVDYKEAKYMSIRNNFIFDSRNKSFNSWITEGENVGHVSIKTILEEPESSQDATVIKGKAKFIKTTRSIEVYHAKDGILCQLDGKTYPLDQPSEVQYEAREWVPEYRNTVTIGSGAGFAVEYHEGYDRIEMRTLKIQPNSSFF